jgi:hypothetical protein
VREINSQGGSIVSKKPICFKDAGIINDLQSSVKSKDGLKDIFIIAILHPNDTTSEGLIEPIESLCEKEGIDQNSYDTDDAEDIHRQLCS